MKKIIASILSAAVLLSACSSAAPAPAAAPDSPAAPAAPAAAAATPAPAAPAAEPITEPVTIRYATWDYPTTVYLQEAIKDFEANNPLIKVEPLEISSNEYNDKVAVMLAGGEDVDVIDVKEMPVYANYVSQRQLLPLGSRVTGEGIDMSYYAGVDAPLYIDGEIYAMPYRNDIYILFYNKDLFDAAGVPYPSYDMTLDEFRELAKQLTHGEGSDKKYGALIHTWPSQVYNYAVAIGDKTLNDGSYEFLKSSYDTILAMQNEDKSVPDFAELKTANIHYSGSFGQAQGAMLMMGTWYISRLISENNDGTIDVNWGMVRAPHLPEAKPGSTVGSVTPLGINAKSKNQDAAWEFVKYLSGEPGAKVLSANGAYTAFQNDETISIYTNVDGFPQDSVDALKAESVALEFPPHPQGNAIKKALEDTHNLMMINELSVDEGIAEMNTLVEEILAEAQ